MDMENDTSYFLDLIRRSHRGRFKIYIGMIAGVGKTYRMLQDAREMLRQGTDVRIGYVETHGRPDTVKALKGLPVIPRKKVFYKGKEMEEMDLDAILRVHPEIVIVDELAHSNVEGCRNAKRWQETCFWTEIVRRLSTQKAVTTEATNALGEKVYMRLCSEPNKSADDIYERLKYKKMPFRKIRIEKSL